MPLVCYVSEQNLNVPLDSDRLLRLLGVSGKLSGFYYAVYMLEQVQQKPDHVLLITKRLYKQTAQHFETTSGCVERNLRTLVPGVLASAGSYPVGSNRWQAVEKATDEYAVP